MIEKIKNLVGSNGQKHWPVAGSDRIAFPNISESIVTDANVGVTFLWTMRDAVVPFLRKENLAIATNFYMPAGIEDMIRNILANPYIRFVIMFGEETLGGQENAQTSANAIRAFFANGLNATRRLAGFESAMYVDKNIPMEDIDVVWKSIRLIDLNKTMPNVTLEEKIAEANRLIETLPKKEPFAAEPKVFDYEPQSGSFPYEGGPIIVHGRNIPHAWIKMMAAVWRYGRDNLMNAGTDRHVKEINNMTVVIHRPQDMDLSINPFLVPLTLEGIDAYVDEMLSAGLPPGKAYTYGNKLRAYRASLTEVTDLVTSVKYRDFEFDAGPQLVQNISYRDGYCEVDQIADMIDVLKRDKYSKACVAITWYPADELMRKHKSSPCLLSIQALVHDGRLNLTVVFRSHDMAQGWPTNAYGCAAIQAEIAKAIDVLPGLLTIISGSAQIYKNYYKQVEEMLVKYASHLGNCTDKRGNYRIKVVEGQIIVTLLHPLTGIELQKYSGQTAYELRDKIARDNSLLTSHAIYLGTELAAAEICRKSGKPYEQDTFFQSSKDLF